MSTLIEEAPVAEPSARRRALDAVRWLGSLRHLSLLAVLAWTAHAHITLAHLLGAPVWLAWALPVAVDAYVLSALRAWETAPARRHRDLRWALGLDAVAVAGSHAATQLEVPALWRAAIAALLGVVLVLVLWRVHALDVEVRAAAPVSRRERRPVVPPVKVTATATVEPPPVVPPVAPPAEPRRLESVAPAPRRGDDDTERQVALALEWLAEDGATRAGVTQRLVEAEGLTLRTAQRRVARAEGQAA